MEYVVYEIPSFVGEEIELDRIYICNSRKGPRIYVVDCDKKLAFNIEEETVTDNVNVGSEEIGEKFINNIPVLTIEEFLDCVCVDEKLNTEIRSNIKNDKIKFYNIEICLVMIQEHEEESRRQTIKTIHNVTKSL